MQRINIFRSGQHTSSSGAAINFTDDMLTATAKSYDTAIHEAPIVVGHPADNGPAYGWVKSVSFADGEMFAEPHQVDEAFSELVKAGRFKKVSASFYTPQAPNNPVPGSYYLRHVGFLGAQPPAVKGLKAIAFSDADADYIEFEDTWDTWRTAGMFRRLRDFLIEKFSKDEADKVIPSYTLEELEHSGRVERDKPEIETNPGMSYSEGNNQGEINVNIEQVQAQLNDAKAQLKEANDKVAELAALNATFAEAEKTRQQQARKTAVKAELEALVAQGRILSAQVAGLTEFVSSLDADSVVEFGEQKQTSRQFMSDFLKSLPARIEFGELSADSGEDGKITPAELGKRIADYSEKHGCSAAEALTAIQSGAKL